MYDVYTVQEYDTLETIALKYNTNINTIATINNNVRDLEVGNQIIVPLNKVSPFITYSVKKGETIYDISQKFNTNYNNILLINGIEKNDYIYESQKLLIPKEGIEIYIVEKDDTLNSVAKKININEETILYDNNSIYLLPDQMIFYKKSR